MTSASPSNGPRWLAAATAVLLLAAALRLFLLVDVPPGLSQDEVLNADIVRFIWEGRLTLFFREGYGHEPLYHYFSAPFQPLLGDNVLSIRLPAVVLGMLLVAATMRWAARDFGRTAALVAGAGLAVSWWPIIFSRVGLRPVLLPLLLVGAAWFWPRPDDERNGRPLLAGLFLGLSLYSYTAARVLFLIPILFLVYAFVACRRLVRPTLVVLATAVLLYLPLALTLRADPSLQQRIEQLGGPLEALQNGDPGPILAATAATLGVFSFTGDPRWTYTLPGRPFFDPFTSLLFYGGLLLALWRLRRPRAALVLIWLAVGLLPSAITPQAPSTIRIVGAMPAVYLLPGLAVAWLWRRVGAARPPAPAVMAALLVAVGGLNLARTVGDGFIRWPAAQETHFKYQTVLLEMARHWDAAGGTPIVADVSFEPIDADSLRRDLGRPLLARWVSAGRALVFPAGGDGRLYVPEFAPPEVELIAAAGLERPRYRSDGDPAFAVYDLPAGPILPAPPQPVAWSGGMTLLNTSSFAGDASLKLLTYWRVERPLPSDLAIFVHLIDADGDIVAQHDSLDAAPATLQPGDRVLQLHTLPRPAGPGPFRLRIGLYQRDSRVRWLTGDAQDALILDPAIFDEK